MIRIKCCNALLAFFQEIDLYEIKMTKKIKVLQGPYDRQNYCDHLKRVEKAQIELLHLMPVATSSFECWKVQQKQQEHLGQAYKINDTKIKNSI